MGVPKFSGQGLGVGLLKEGIVAAGAEEFLQHEMVGELAFIEEHGGGKAHGANEEG